MENCQNSLQNTHTHTHTHERRGEECRTVIWDRGLKRNSTRAKRIILKCKVGLMSVQGTNRQFPQN